MLIIVQFLSIVESGPKSTEAVLAARDYSTLHYNTFFSLQIFHFSK